MRPWPFARSKFIDTGPKITAGLFRKKPPAPILLPKKRRKRIGTGYNQTIAVNNCKGSCIFAFFLIQEIVYREV
jgi:hypothetical protein